MLDSEGISAVGVVVTNDLFNESDYFCAVVVDNEFLHFATLGEKFLSPPTSVAVALASST